MERKKSGRKTSLRILNVEPGKKCVKLVMEGGKKLTLSEDAFLSDYLYPGKELSPEELASLARKSQGKKEEDYLHTLLSRGRYTLQGVEDRLAMKFHTDEKRRKELLAPYIASGILSDESFASDYLESALGSCYGENYLRKALLEKKTDKKVLLLPSVQEKLKENSPFLPGFVKEMEEKLLSLPERKRKEKEYAFFLRRGFSFEEILSAISKVQAMKTEEERGKEKEEQAKELKKEARQCYNSLAGRESADSQKAKKAFFGHLLRKGFSYDEIESVVRKEGYFKNDQGFNA
ncbi:MAG: RecX family transcriptional regulator [Bacilli bacterium]